MRPSASHDIQSHVVSRSLLESACIMRGNTNMEVRRKAAPAHLNHGVNNIFSNATDMTQAKEMK